jgi:hypothetical protein
VTRSPHVETRTHTPIRQDHDQPIIYLSQRVQEHLLVGGQIDMGPIESLRLVFARQAKEDQHMISSVRQPDRLCSNSSSLSVVPMPKPAAKLTSVRPANTDRNSSSANRHHRAAGAACGHPAPMQMAG